MRLSSGLQKIKTRNPNLTYLSGNTLTFVRVRHYRESYLLTNYITLTFSGKGTGSVNAKIGSATGATGTIYQDLNYTITDGGVHNIPISAGVFTGNNQTRYLRITFINNISNVFTYNLTIISKFPKSYTIYSTTLSKVINEPVASTTTTTTNSVVLFSALRLVEAYQSGAINHDRVIKSFNTDSFSFAVTGGYTNLIDTKDAPTGSLGIGDLVKGNTTLQLPINNFPAEFNVNPYARFRLQQFLTKVKGTSYPFRLKFMQLNTERFYFDPINIIVTKQPEGNIPTVYPLAISTYSNLTGIYGLANVTANSNMNINIPHNMASTISNEQVATLMTSYEPFKV